MAFGTRYPPVFRLLGAIALLLFLGTLLLSSPESTSLADSPVSYIATSANRDRGHRPFEMEGLALGSEFVPPLDIRAGEDHTAWLITSLQSRFQATLSQQATGAPSYPRCSLKLERYAKTALLPTTFVSRWWSGRRKSVVSFAINLYNSEAIIPAQALALLEAVAHLMQNNMVYISIYENGSKDNTRSLLSDLGAALKALEVDGIWIHSSNMLSDFGKHDRIVVLSEIRNLALAPLMPYASSDGDSGTLVMMNDVMTCASDILELVHQQRLHRASMAFGMDWGSCTRATRQGERGFLYGDDPRYDPENPPSTQVPRFYDLWVGRGISGNAVYDFSQPGGYSPKSDNESWVVDAYSTENEALYRRWLEGRPIPVYSGWGGMSAFDASLFTREHLRFRSTVTAGWKGGSTDGALGDWGRLIGGEGYLESDCPGASECEYIARDIWNMRHGRARIVLAPQARTTYNIQDWLVMEDAVPVTRLQGAEETERDIIDWTEYEIPESVVCIPTRTSEGEWINAWGETNYRTRIDPLWKPVNMTGRDRGSERQRRQLSNATNL